MSSAQENRAIRDYLDLLKDWVYNAWINGVEFDEIHQSLVHYRDPWISASTLRSALKRWRTNPQPLLWPYAQPQRNPEYIIPQPPEVWGLVRLRHSLPERPRPAQPDQRPHPHSAPRSFMRTSAIGHDMAMAARYLYPGIPSQQLVSNTPQMPLVVHQNPIPQPAEDNHEIDAEYEPDVPQAGDVCRDCGLIVGDQCECNMYG